MALFDPSRVVSNRVFFGHLTDTERALYLRHHVPGVTEVEITDMNWFAQEGPDNSGPPFDMRPHLFDTYGRPEPDDEFELYPSDLSESAALGRIARREADSMSSRGTAKTSANTSSACMVGNCRFNA